MKKQITTLFLTAATVFAALTFTACGEDDGPNPPVPTGETVFSSADDDATRTSIDRKANFYWEIGDKIWVEGGTGYKASSQSDITASKQARAKFVVDSTFSGSPIKVLYTGHAAGDTTSTTGTSYNKVTIADVQTQSDWNDGSHLGTSGDCASGYAHKKPGGYQFTLDHKASYLMLYPYLNSSLSGYTLEKIEIYSDLSASSIAGEFPFTFENGLADLPNTGTGKQQITLNCGTGSNFQLSTDFPADITSTTITYRHCFVVIAPGTHQLTIKYITKNASNETIEFVKDINANKYVANGVYPLIHELKDALVTSGMVFNAKTYYAWGVTTDAQEWTANNQSGYSTAEYLATFPDLITTTYPSDDFWPEIPTNLERGKYFALAEREYVYWDNSTEWTLNHDNGTQETRRGGLWVRKKQFNLGWINNESNGTRFVPNRGRPAASEVYQYFFLPAFAGVNATTIYWTRSRYGQASLIAEGKSRICYAVSISASNVLPELLGDYTGRVAGRRPPTGNADGSSNTAWWQ